MLDDEEIESGLTDGGNDGGTDAIYFIVNQRQLDASKNLACSVLI
jgi:hypothetical protein